MKKVFAFSLILILIFSLVSAVSALNYEETTLPVPIEGAEHAMPNTGDSTYVYAAYGIIVLVLAGASISLAYILNRKH